MREKLTEDGESKAIPDIIFSTKYYDLDDFANLNGLNGIIVKIAKSKQNTFASDRATAEAKSAANLAKFLEPLNDRIKEPNGTWSRETYFTHIIHGGTTV